MAKDNLYIGYDETADELIITSNPKKRTVGYFIDSGTAVLLDRKNFRPYGLSFLFLKEYFKKNKTGFAKIPLNGSVALSTTIVNQLTAGK